MDDKDELKAVEADMVKFRNKLVKAFGTDEELELKRKISMLKKRHAKLLRRMKS